MDTIIPSNSTEKEYEVIHLEKTNKVCGLCENFCSAQIEKGNFNAVVSCEGACLRGEISRRAANSLSFEDPSAKTVRICLGSAFTKDSGQRNLIRSAERVIILEGCFLKCASRMIKGVLPTVDYEVITLDKHYNFNKKLFAINEATEDELIKYTNEAVSEVKKIINTGS